MKFISQGSKPMEYEYPEEIPRDNDTGKPRHMPSYFDAAKKAISSNKKPSEKP